MKLSNDGKILLTIAGIALLLICISAGVANSNASDELTLSTYSSRSGGAKATFRLIQELGYSAERWVQDPAALPQDAKNTLLIEMNPRRLPSDDQREAINRFLQNGGTLLIAGPMSSVFLREGFGVPEIPSQSWKDYPAMAPHPLNNGIPSITMPAGVYSYDRVDAIPLFGKESKPVAIELRHGSGSIVWLASPVPLSNAGLLAKGNPEFLANLLAVNGSQRVLWDVYFTEDAPEKHSAFRVPALVAGSAQLLFIFGLVLWTHSRRSGPVREFGTGPVPMSQMEFVESLGSLYHTAKATNVAVQVAYARFSYLAGRRLGVAPGNVNKLGEAVAHAFGERARDVVDFFTECDNVEHHGRLTDDEAIAKVQRLQKYLEKLNLVPKPQEKR